MPTPRPARRQSTTGPRSTRAANVFGGARGEILSELCGKRLTAVELANRFSITSTAIRAHLNELRNSGLVHYRTEVRGVGKPTHVYELTPDGQYLVSSAYVPALVCLLRTASAQLGNGIDELIRDAGRSLADLSSASPQGRGTRSKAERLAAVIRSFGGSAEVREVGSDLLVESECCPLAAVVGQAPTACKLFEGMALAITGTRVEEHCDRRAQPHCLFRIPNTSKR